MKKMRKLASHFGLGKRWLRLQHLFRLGIFNAIRQERFKAKHLPLIKNAPPIEAGTGVEVHLLLHHKRLYEGMWALYSFAYFSGQPCRFIIHEDGSFTHPDCALLKQVFPGCQIVMRADADARVLGHFEQLGLSHCARLRQSLVFGLKLFDPMFFSSEQKFIVMDSDVLFFSRPNSLIENLSDSSPPRYSLDIENCYCLNETILVELLGQPPIDRFNPGVFCAKSSDLNLERIESFLNRPEFWNEKGDGDYFAELTLWAMELTAQNALPLPTNYAICPLNLEDPNLVFGHFCGGVRNTYHYYTKALPRLSTLLNL